MMSLAPPGYFGRYLRIDLSTGEQRACSLDENVLRRSIGGVGLGTEILLRECPPQADPLGPAAPLIFAFSPLIGTPLTTSAKFAVVAKSPLTQRLNDSLSSSAFAISGKHTGYDAIVIVGAAAAPVHLVIAAGGVRLESAANEWGLSSRETESRVRSRFGNELRVASIGPAGERLVRYATVSHDGRHAARGGLGAVMGSKRLKSVAVAGDQRPQVAHPRQLAEYARGLSAKTFGPATAKYRELGTVSNLPAFNRLGVLPTRNFQEGSFEGADRLAPDAMSAEHPRTRASCAACTIGCEHIFQIAGGSGVRMEYENLFALGPLCGISDPAVVLEASRYCDEAGIDTISAGVCCAFAMECAERGLIDAPNLRFGDGASLLQLLREIAAREGLGALLADGVRSASERIGQGSGEFAAHVKGLELPGYEPRGLQTMALGLAVNARGADHNRSGAYQADFSEQADRFQGDERSVLLAIATEDEAALMDSLILCKFLRGVFEDRTEAMAEMLRLVTGWDVTSGELARIARRIVAAKKLFNIRQGWTPDEDILPARFFDEPLRKGVSEGARLSRQEFGAQVHAYNTARGWSDEGWLPRELMESLELG